MSSEALFIQDSMGGFDEFGVPNFVKQTKNFYGYNEEYNEEYDEEYDEELQTFLNTRGIKFLLHFTDSRNIPSIWRYGMLSRTRLDEMGFSYCYSDEKRLDNRLNYISLSITNYNKFLYQVYKERGTIKDGVLVYIDASILYKENNDRIYYSSNAASKNVPHGSEIRDLKNLFNDEIHWVTSYGRRSAYREENKADNEPTNIQAEILFEGVIPPEYIKKIVRIDEEYEEYEEYRCRDDFEPPF